MNDDMPQRPPVRLPELLKQLDQAQPERALPEFDLDAVVRGGRRRQRRGRVTTATALLAGAAAATGVLLLGAGGTPSESLVPAQPPGASPYSPPTGPAPTASALTAPAPRGPTLTTPAATTPAPTAPGVAVAPSAPASSSAKASPRAATTSPAASSGARGPATGPSTTSTGSAPSAQVPSSSFPPASAGCAAAAAYTFVQAVTATATGGTVAVTAHPATLVCGGVDDRNFRIAGSTQTLHLTAAATVSVLEVGVDVTPRQIAPVDLPGWLTTDSNQKVFQIAGPPDAVTSLVEQYHP